MLKPVEKLNTDITESHKMVIDSLKELLEQAEKGEIEGIVVAISHSNREVRWSRSGMHSIYTIVGCLQCAAKDILDTHD